MLSRSTRIRNRIREAYLHTEFELNGLRGDGSVSQHEPKDDTRRTGEIANDASAQTAQRHRGAA